MIHFEPAFLFYYPKAALMILKRFTHSFFALIAQLMLIEYNWHIYCLSPPSVPSLTFLNY